MPPAGLPGTRRGRQDQDHAAASSGLAGRTAASAISALILAARAFRAWLVGALDPVAAQGAPRYALSRCGKPAGDQARLADLGQSRCPGSIGGAVGRRGNRSGPGWGIGPGLVGALVLGWSRLVAGGPGRGWSCGPGVVQSVRRCVSVSAQHVGQRGPHRQDQDRQAGHEGGHGPWRPRRPGLGQQVIGHLTGHPEREGADRRPLGEPAGPVADPSPRGPARRAARTRRRLRRPPAE